MGMNQVGRGRSIGLGQQDMAPRQPRRAGSAITIAYQRAGARTAPAQQQVLSKPAKTHAAQQTVVVRTAAKLPSTQAAVATGSVSNPEMPRVRAAKAIPTGADKPASLAGSTCAAKTRELLSNPAYKDFLAASGPALVKNMEVENLDFLLDLKKFRENPTPDMAKDLKKTYIDAGNEELDMQFLKASDFGKDFSNKGLNIEAPTRKGFKHDFDHCMKMIERGEPIGRSGISFVFDKIEEHASKLLLKALKIT